MPNILICLVSKLWSRFVPLEDDPWPPASRGRCDSNHDYDKTVSQVRNSRSLQKGTRLDLEAKLNFFLILYFSLLP